MREAKIIEILRRTTFDDLSDQSIQEVADYLLAHPEMEIPTALVQVKWARSLLRFTMGNG